MEAVASIGDRERRFSGRAKLHRQLLMLVYELRQYTALEVHYSDDGPKEADAVLPLT